jgi:hypothetical protein
VTYVADARQALLAALPNELEDGLVDLYTLLVLRRGETATREDVHDAWSVWRSREQPEHCSVRPFDELSAEVQASDDPYVQAIHQAAQALQRV